MKRDMDLIRDILLKIEGDPSLDGTRYTEYTEVDFPEHSRQEIFYHMDLLFEAQLTDGAPSMHAPCVSRLTWDGHEFLAAIKDPGVWNKTKERAKGAAMLTLPIIIEIAKQEMKKHLGLP